MINLLKNNKDKLLLGISLLVFFLVNLLLLKNKLPIGTNTKLYYLIYFGVCILIVGIVYIIKYLLRKEIKIEKIFLYLGITLGLFFLVLSPFFTGSDEHNHFYRIYEISEGVFKTPTKKYVGSVMPSSLSKIYALNETSGLITNQAVKYKNVIKMMKIKLNKKDSIQYGTDDNTYYENTALYSPVTYLPHIVGIYLGRILNLNPYYIGMLGRLSNLICYLILGYIALKMLPRYKLFFLVILLSPNMIQLASTLSADAFTNIVFLLIISYIFKLRDSKKVMSFKDEVILFGLAIIISLSKIVYLPIVLSILLIKKEQFKRGKKEKIIYTLMTFMVSGIISLLWIKGTKDIFDIAYFNSHLQKDFILHHLLQYGLVFLNTFIIHGIYYIECLFGGTKMYHSQLMLPSVISFAYVLIVGICFISERQKDDLNIIEKAGCILVGLMIMGLASTAIYLQCTAQFYGIAYPTIEGIQGRYFIPIIFMLPFMFKFKNKSIKLDNKIIIDSVIVINIITMFYMITQFVV